jgi:hypothetical protein
VKIKKFKSGAIREDKSYKSRPDLISPYFQERLAFVLAKGATLYGDKNWEAGIPNESFLQSLERHLLAYKQSINKGYSTHNKQEDHLGQAAFNLMGLIHNEEISKLK